MQFLLDNYRQHGVFNTKNFGLPPDTLKTHAVLCCLNNVPYLALNPNRPGLNFKQERLGQGYHNPALESFQKFMTTNF